MFADLCGLSHFEAKSPCRYVQANMLSSLEGLEAQEALDTLNVSGNRLKRLEKLAGCASLHTLLASSNELETVEDVQHLTECIQLSTVDLQDNQAGRPPGKQPASTHS